MEIKPFLCTAQGQPRANGQELVVCAVSQSARQNYLAAKNRMAEMEKQTQAGCAASGVSSIMGILLMVLGMAAIPVLFSGGIMALVEVAACAGLVLGIVYLINRSTQKKAQQVKATPAYQQAAAVLQQASRQLDLELGLPGATQWVDVLTFPYRVENGIVRDLNQESGQPRYNNVMMRMYVADGRLYLVGDWVKYGFDLSCLKTFNPVAGPIVINRWNKWPTHPGNLGATQVDDEDSSRGYRVNAGCSVLWFKMDDSCCPVYIPAYERPTFQRCLH